MKALPVKPIRLSVRLTLTYGMVFGVILAILSVGVIMGTYAFLLSNAQYDMRQTIEMIDGRVLDEYYESEPLDVPEVMQGYESNPLYNISLMDPSGEIITVHTNFEADEGASIAREQSIHDESAVVALLKVERSLLNEKAFMHVMERMIILFDAVSIVFALCVSFLVARRMLRPIQTMTDTARRISMSALDERLAIPSSDDELTRLAQTFNSMLDRLQGAFAMRNRFVSDASHELRTPLMVIQGYADVLNRWGKKDEAVLNEALSAISQEAVGMNDLIEKLLFLARGDAGQQTLDISRFSLSKVYGELKREYALLSPSHILTVDCPKDIWLTADRSMVKRMLRALLNNAVQYTPEDKEIRLEARLDTDAVRIVVEDKGIGIAADELPFLFDRFYRVNHVRDKATGGSGLGLSIAKSIVQEHNGTIGVESQPAEGTRFIIHLPT